MSTCYLHIDINTPLVSMPLWKIALRSIQFRSLSSILTAFSMSLGVALIVTVIVLHGVLDSSFRRSAQGYDYIIAGKGSPMDVVLSTVFYLRAPVGSVPESYLTSFKRGAYSHLTEEAIPVSIGHFYQGATIVGTSPEFFSKLTYMGDRKYECAEGKFFDTYDTFSAVVGSRAAKKTGLKVGDTFKPEVAQEVEFGMDHLPFTVMGIMKHTGTPNDNVIFVNIDGFYDMHGHEAEDEDAGHADADHAGHSHDHGKRQYSAILLMTRQKSIRPADGQAINPDDPDFNPAALLEERTFVDIEAANLPMQLDRTTDVQAVSPVQEIATLLDSVIGNIQMVLIFLAVLVVIVAGIGMMVSIYNSMNERKQEIAVMRALGARRLTVMSIILLESILLSLGGGVLGVIFGHALLAGMNPWISSYTGIVVPFWSFQAMEMVLIPGLVILASLVGFLPAAVAYKQDVATSLNP